MKIVKLFIAIIAALIFASCSEDIETGDTRFVAKRFVAQTEKANESAGSRTQTVDDGKKVVWSSGDKISVISTVEPSSGFKEFTLNSGAGSDDAEFVHATGFSNTEIQPYVAVYGTGTLTYDDSKVSGIVVPQAQKAVSNGFDPHAAPMTAYTTSDKVNFKHICSFIKVTIDAGLASQHVKHITFKARNGEFVSGVLENVQVGTDGIATYSVKEGTGHKTAYLENGGNDIPAGTYYIAVLPGTLANGFDIKFEAQDLVYMNRTQSGIKITVRQKIHSLGTFTETTTWTDTYRPEVLYSGEFSVSATQKVYFSSGNLQAVMSGTNTVGKWQLAQQQYEYIGTTSHNSNSGNADRTNAGAGKIVSLFSFTDPAKGYTGAKSYGIWSANTAANCVSAAGNTSCDWGKAYTDNAESDYDWRVPSSEEWTYLLAGGRQDYCSSVCMLHIGTQDIRGLIIYPNGFGDAQFAQAGFTLDKSTTQTKSGIIHYKISGTEFTNQYVAFNAAANSGSFLSGDNFIIGETDWKNLEKLGCMFMPQEGYVNNYSYSSENLAGYYHCSDGAQSETQVYRVNFTRGVLTTNVGAGQVMAQYGMSIRLIANKNE